MRAILRIAQLCACGPATDNGGSGYGDAYARTGWARRSRVIQITSNANGTSVLTWKRLDNDELATKDVQTLL